jgi:hypothetical protein
MVVVMHLAFGKRRPLAALLLLPLTAACSAPLLGGSDEIVSLSDAAAPWAEDAAAAAPGAPSLVASSAPRVTAPIWDAGCTPSLVGHERVAPSISIVLGSSATMAQRFGDSTRWAAVRTSVVGFAAELASSARVGLAVVGAPLDHGIAATGTACAPVARVTPALGSLAAVTSALGEPPGTSASSALGAGVAAASQDLAALAASGPVHLVLVVDALPSTCSGVASPAGLDEAALSVQRAAIDTHVIALGSDLGDADAKRIAGGSFSRALSPAGLDEAFAALAADLAPCAFVLGSQLDPASSHSATVTMGSTRLAAGTDYQLSGTELSLLGSACSTLRAAPAEIAITLPCAN